MTATPEQPALFDPGLPGGQPGGWVQRPGWDYGLSFVVLGQPAPQGSKRAMAIRKGGVYTGKAVAFENNHKKTHAWRDTVADSAIDAIEDWQEATGRPWALLDAPLLVECVFSMARPGKPKFDRPATVPDLSKLIRATEDALTRIVWRDDSRVVEYGRLAKVWAGSTDPEALPFPGAQIRIWRKQ